MDSRNSVNPKQDKPKENHAHKYHSQTAEKQILKNKQKTLKATRNDTYRRTMP